MPVTQEQWPEVLAQLDTQYWRVSSSPVWYSPDDYDPAVIEYMGAMDQATYLTAMEHFHTWVREAGDSGMSVDSHRNRNMTIHNTAIPVVVSFRVYPGIEYDDTLARLFDFSNRGDCPNPACSEQVDGFGFCSGCERIIRCDYCGMGGMSTRIEHVGADDDPLMLACNFCTAPCSTRGCERLSCRSTDETGEVRYYRTCREHVSLGTCGICEGMFESQFLAAINGVEMCGPCRENVCEDCDVHSNGLQRDTESGLRLCFECWTTRNRGRFEEYDADADMTPEEMLIPALPNRPVRLVSFEQEFMSPNGEREGTRLASTLSNLGVCWTPAIQGYHAGSHNMPCHVEHDSSVTGGELIYNRLNLADPEDAQAMVTILSEVRNRVRDGSVQFTLNCGGHIHVDLHGYTITDTRNLVTVFNYLEDPIFRLAGSHYEDHRTVIFNDRYSAPIIKGAWRTDREFGVEFLRNSGHSDALNLQHYYNAIRSHCSCGAMEFGDHSECTCTLPKCTAEWRVFNGTGNPRKLHAYMAFVLSMHAWCQGRELDPDEFPSMGLNPAARDFAEPYNTTQTRTIEEWKTRLDWIFRNLTFTDAEKDSLIYVIRNSVLRHTGEDFITSLAELETIPDERVLEAPMRAARQLVPSAGSGGRVRPCRGCGEHPSDCYCDDDRMESEPF